MTFAEIFLLLAVAALLFAALKPARLWLEARLYRFFRSRSKNPHRPIIDITDYKKDKPKP
jgi:hypothetical protein